MPSQIRQISLVACLCWTVALGCAQANDKPSDDPKPMKEISTPPEKLATEAVKSADWQTRLTPEQYRILRNAGTEAPNGDVYHQFKEQGSGTYYCAGCGTALFSSKHKFDSRCGWPSFWDPARIDSIETRPDYSHGRVRTEVVCGSCEGHLGHLFEGEGFDTPTDQRYCINGTVLIFVPAAEDSTEEE
jgi:peptide-methionine (R)-S-oxide reductase